MPLPDNQDPAWDSLANQWRTICLKERIVRGTPEYIARANKFFNDLYLAGIHNNQPPSNGH